MKRQISLAGDVELNPGPVTRKRNADSVLNSRLQRYGLRPLEVGGMGNCLFRSVAHQLYNDESCHFEIRISAVEYLQKNPDRFIESAVVDTSWLEYITNMSMEGTWVITS